MKSIFPVLLAIFSLTAARAQSVDPLTAPQPAPDFVRQADSEFAAPQPIVPVVMPPVVPPRPPLPPPSGSAGFQPAFAAAGMAALPGQLPARQSLAWRALASRLAENKSDTTNQRILAQPFSDGMLSVLSCCADAGLVVEALNSASGQVLAHGINSARPLNVVIVLWETENGQTVVKAQSMGDARAWKTEAVKRFLDGLVANQGKHGAI